MESVTDPDLLRDRAFFKLGEFVFDYRKAVIAVGLLSCILLGSLMSMGPDWAEAWGEGDLESVEAVDLKDSAFASEEDGVERFVLLVNHPTMTDQSLEWQNAVIKALEDFSEMEDVDIEFRPEALRAVAQKAMDRKTGARGLRSILESVLLPTMYELPDQANAVKVVVNEQCITGESEPLVVLDNAELQHAASDE